MLSWSLQSLIWKQFYSSSSAVFGISCFPLFLPHLQRIVCSALQNCNTNFLLLLPPTFNPRKMFMWWTDAHTNTLPGYNCQLLSGGGNLCFRRFLPTAGQWGEIPPPTHLWAYWFRPISSFRPTSRWHSSFEAKLWYGFKPQRFAQKTQCHPVGSRPKLEVGPNWK